MNRLSLAIILLAFAVFSYWSYSIYQDQYAPLTADKAGKIAQKAYTFGYPLVVMNITKDVMTAAPSVDNDSQKAPINQFSYMQSFPDPQFRDVVRPNVDTLYSIAWLDLAEQPIVLNVPNTEGRYYLIQMLDAWTNVFASPGTRTMGSHAGHFAITGPAWKGQLPQGIEEIKAPTNLVWIIGRIETRGEEDIPSVNKLQNLLTLIPLSAWNSGNNGMYAPPKSVLVDPTVDTTTPPPTQVAQMDANTFLEHLARLLNETPLNPQDAKTLLELKQIGISTSEPFTLQTMDPAIQKAITDAIPQARQQIMESATAIMGGDKGWQVLTGALGEYGKNYLLRAVVAEQGLGANLTADAIYASTSNDAEGIPLNGRQPHVLHFAADKLPPVRGFWSITLYDADGYLVANSIDRYAIGDRDKLQYNPDGSLDVYIQHAPPKGLESNWLPAPEGPYNLLMRLYWPEKQIASGSWLPPTVESIPSPEGLRQEQRKEKTKEQGWLTPNPRFYLR